MTILEQLANCILSDNKVDVIINRGIDPEPWRDRIQDLLERNKLIAIDFIGADAELLNAWDRDYDTLCGEMLQ